MNLRVYVPLVALLQIAWPVARASAQTTTVDVMKSTVEGRVYDSLSRAPLSGAAVSLVSADSRLTYGAVSDSIGRYVLQGVQPGAYLVGFFHPLLDSIGIQSPVRRVTIAAPGRSPTRVDLGVPSADRIHDSVCGARAKGDSTGIFVGHVQDATTRGFVSGATITAHWVVLTVFGGRILSATPTASATSDPNGWFAFCGLPVGAAISFVASSGLDSSGAVNFGVPAHGALHRDLFVGAFERVTRGPVDTAATPDSLRIPAEILHRGTGRLNGVVRDAGSHAPLTDVQVTVVGTGLTIMANERGEFSLARLPLGTQTIAARRVGYVPVEQLIDLLAQDTTRINVELSTIKSVLDTVRVTASRVYSADRNGFYRRQRNGFGHYFDAEQIAHINPMETSGLVTRIPGVRTTSSGFDRTILMRSGSGYCTPLIVVDGFVHTDMTFDDLDLMVRPDQVEGIEIYTSQLGVPPELLRGFQACGMVAVWTQPRKPRPRQP